MANTRYSSGSPHRSAGWNRHEGAVAKRSAPTAPSRRNQTTSASRVNERDVQQVIEHRHAAECRQHVGQPPARAFGQRQQGNRRAERHQQERAATPDISAGSGGGRAPAVHRLAPDRGGRRGRGHDEERRRGQTDPQAEPAAFGRLRTMIAPKAYPRPSRQSTGPACRAPRPTARLPEPDLGADRIDELPQPSAAIPAARGPAAEHVLETMTASPMCRSPESAARPARPAAPCTSRASR